MWINEATSDDTGSLFYQYLRDVLEINNLFFDTKNKYDILYKEFNIEKSMQGITLVALVITIVILIILATVAISFAFGQDGLIQHAQDAEDYQANADAQTAKVLNDATDYIEGIVGGD